MISYHLIHHYNIVISNQIGQTINSNIIPTNKYYYDRSKEWGKVVEY